MFKHTYLFLTATVFAIIYIFFLTEQTPFFLSIAVKIIPMLCFIIFIFAVGRDFRSPYRTFILLGLSFCLIGDATLHWFVFGLSAFLIGHICYIIAFLKLRTVPPSKPAMIILLFYGIIMAAWIVGNVLRSGDIVLSIAVIAYIGVILTMVWAALQTNKPVIIFGAIAFLISDSILALNMFIASIQYSTLLIMSTYYIAQFLFAISIPKYFVKRTKVLE